MKTEQNKIPEATQAPPHLAMQQKISGFWVSRAIYVAAKLAIADLVKDRPRTAAELAQATGTHAPSLYRVLRALASLRIFAKDDDDRFHLTPLAATLQSDAPLGTQKKRATRSIWRNLTVFKAYRERALGARF